MTGVLRFPPSARRPTQENCGAGASDHGAGGRVQKRQEEEEPKTWGKSAKQVPGFRATKDRDSPRALVFVSVCIGSALHRLVLKACGANYPHSALKGGK